MGADCSICYGIRRNRLERFGAGLSAVRLHGISLSFFCVFHAGYLAFLVASAVGSRAWPFAIFWTMAKGMWYALLPSLLYSLVAKNRSSYARGAPLSGRRWITGLGTDWMVWSGKRIGNGTGNKLDNGLGTD